MAILAARKQFENVRELIDHLGGIAPERIRMSPLPGTATEKDLLKIVERKTGLCELIDGVLVDKPLGAKESGVAGQIGHRIETYLAEHDIGTTFGADATLRILSGMVRLPDVSFVRWEKLPDRCYPNEPIPDLVPDLAVEVLSEGNTLAEMNKKREDYFRVGVALVWYVDLDHRTVSVYTSPDDVAVLEESDTFDGGSVLPGFTLPVAHIFARVRKPPSGRRRKK